METNEKSAVQSIRKFERIFAVLAVLNVIGAAIGIIGGMITQEGGGLVFGIACFIGAVSCVFFCYLVGSIIEISNKLDNITKMLNTDNDHK